MIQNNQKRLFLDAAFQTRGGQARRINQDAAICLSEKGIFMVADGLGGAARGEVASRLAIETVSRTLQKKCPSVISPSDILNQEQISALSKTEYRDDERSVLHSSYPDGQMADHRHLRMALLFAHSRITKEAEAHHDLKGMGTAAVLGWLRGEKLYVAHVGDCRAYLFKNNEFMRLTEDHSLVNALERRGILSEQEAKRHPLRNRLTQVLGGDMLPVPEITVTRLKPGHRVMLCSDGVWSALGEREMGGILNGKGTPSTICGALVESSLRMEHPDDATALVMMFRDEVSEKTSMEE